MFACTLFGIDRQVYYRKIKRRKHKQLKASKVVSLVIEIRQSMPRIGAKKMYYLLNNELKQLKIGRDKFIDILRANHLLIVPKRSYHITTNSHHRFRKHKNLVNTLEIEKPESVWVSDITYVGARKNPSYLALITDAYSKKVMGYHISSSLAATESRIALDMAIKSRKYKESLIHHSDRGLQYSSIIYKEGADANNITISMTENGDPYENAIAERINGILKQEHQKEREY